MLMRPNSGMLAPMRKKILWAVDAFPDNRKLQASQISFLRTMSKNAEVDIYPVYLLSPDQLNINIEFSQPWVSEFLPSAQKTMGQLLSKVKIKGLQPHQVILQSSPSLRKSVLKLIEHAKGAEIDLICLGTHARKGIARMMLGSFAESLILLSAVPVCVINPETKVAPSIKKILFPTDFSSGSEHAFGKAIDWAKQLKAKLVLFHKIPNPIEPVFQSGVYLLGGAWVPVADFFEEERTRIKSTAAKWIDRAKQQGVSAEFQIHDKSGSVVEAVISAGKKNGVQAIALAAESGSVSTAVLGSIARQIVRKAPYPVLVFK